MIHLLRQIFHFLFHDPHMLVIMGWERIAPYFTTDKFFMKVKYRIIIGYWMDFDNPRTFNEKLQWLKFNNIHPEYTQMVDKVAAKDYVRNIIGDEYIIPTLGVWNSVDEIDWNSLPDKFVIKGAGDSGSVVICTDKKNFDIGKAKAHLKKTCKRNYSLTSKEYPYYNVPRRFIAEELLENERHDVGPDFVIICSDGIPSGDNCSEEIKKICLELAGKTQKAKLEFFKINGTEWYVDLTDLTIGNITGYSVFIENGIKIIRSKNPNKDIVDYKFFCFDGTPFCYKMDFGRGVEHHANYYDLEGTFLPFGELGFHFLKEKKFFQPTNFQEMLDIVTKLCQGFPFIRVDLYNVSGRIHFGELTFFPYSGMMKFAPEEWDYKLGELLKIGK